MPREQAAVDPKSVVAPAGTDGEEGRLAVHEEVVQPAVGERLEAEGRGVCVVVLLPVGRGVRGDGRGAGGEVRGVG